ncbi:hypothetical protein [Pseudanabaena sp. FACHB-2040]|uniref:hypothetical protein n=1 Tax=Pseudanabaena sp. FACHB-2040 TaxID=2692859 RepID=UPI0016888AAE|nr:hypothetical protein [Pseudanabaena sp. FACHB-2040]MBD2259896.1 hypothetical protein [Pseudanabaena sp. FACHB-2040]
MAKKSQIKLDLAKAEEVARQAILDWADQGWPIWELDDDGHPIPEDVGCVRHWAGIGDVEVVSCCHEPDEDERIDAVLYMSFEVEAKVDRWENGNRFEEDDYSQTFLETIRVWVGFDGEDYWFSDSETIEQEEVDNE